MWWNETTGISQMSDRWSHYTNIYLSKFAVDTRCTADTYVVCLYTPTRKPERRIAIWQDV